MGGGSYSVSARSTRAAGSGFYTKSASEIFESRNLKESMNPKGVDIREARDSEEHPNSLAVCIALDVTGSMGKNTPSLSEGRFAPNNGGHFSGRN